MHYPATELQFTAVDNGMDGHNTAAGDCNLNEKSYTDWFTSGYCYIWWQLADCHIWLQLLIFLAYLYTSYLVAATE